MKKTKILIAIVAATLFVACQPSSKNYIGSFEGFVEKVEHNADTYTDEDWEQADARFAEFTEKKLAKVERHLTSEGKKAIGKLHARYYKARAKSAGKQLLDQLQDGLDYFEGFTEGLTEESNNQ